MTGAVTTRTARRASRQPQATRRLGYVVSILINGAGLYLINVWPGWHAAPFLTSATTQVLAIVNAMLIATVAVNLLYLLTDPRLLVALGNLGTTLLGLIASIRIWEVFPFDFGNTSLDWSLVFRVILVVSIAGCCIAILVQLVQLVRTLARGPRAAEPR